MALKMVAVDIDGTILNPEGRIPSCTFRTFEEVTSGGGYVAIVTGREKGDIFEVFLQNGYRLGRDGYPHALAAADRIYYLTQREYLPDEEWNEKAEEWWLETQPLAKVLMDGVLLQLEGYRYERTGDGYLWFHNLEDALYAQEIITGYLREKGITSLKLERNGWGVALVDVRLGKGNCLHRIVRKMGIRPEEVVAIGNSHNDESMLDRRMGFLPACPSNADKDIIDLVREKGGIVAVETCGWGVAEIIGKVFGDDE